MKRVLTLGAVAALGLALVAPAQAVPDSAAAAAPNNNGYWKLTDTIIFEDTGYPDYLKVVSGFDGEYRNDNGVYTWQISGDFGDVNVTEEYNAPEGVYSAPADYTWPAPPAKATVGQKFNVTMSIEDLSEEAWPLSGKPNNKLIYRFDHVDVLPGATSGWDYPGIGMGGWDGPKTWTGTLVFPQYTATTGWAANKGRTRLQLESTRFSVQYVYTWVPGGKMTITCVKGKKKIKVTGVNPKCPRGYFRK